MKKVLIVSPYFPPINAPDMQRVRMSLGYYRAGGWEPVVLAVDERWQGGASEPDLLATLPPGTRIVKTAALPLRWSRWIGLGTLGLRCWPFLLWRGSRLLRREKFDLVFFSNTQFITFALGPLWRRLHGVPYVLDVQDPWLTDYYDRPGARRPPGGWKYRFAHLLARIFEGPSFTRAAAIMSVSPAYLDELRRRYPGLADKPAAVIRFGANRTDLVVALAQPGSSPPFSRGQGEIHLLYTGASGPITPHALRVLFTGLGLFRTREPAAAGRLRLHFVGTSYAAPGLGRNSVVPIAEECGVGDLVAEIPHRIGFLEALRLQQAADVLLLLGSSDLAYSPSKIFQYFLSGRPILGVVFRDSVMERLLDDLSCAFEVRFTEAGPKDDAHARLGEFFELLARGGLAAALPQRNQALFDSAFLADGLTREQCALFDRALEFPGRRIVS